MNNVIGSYWSPINGRRITWHKGGEIIDIPVGDFGDFIYGIMLDSFPVPISGVNEYLSEDGFLFPNLNKINFLSYDK